MERSEACRERAEVAAGLWRVLNYFSYLACVGETLNHGSHDTHLLQEQWPSGMT